MKRINIKYLVVSLILVLSLSLNAGCIAVPGTDNSPPASPPATEEEVTTSPPVSTPATANTTPIDSGLTPPLIGSQAPLLPSIADVVARVKPSVVAITTETISLDFFSRPYTQEGAGSGWIISEDGYIVTNNHVIEGAKSITVTLDDDRTVPADIVGADSLTDLAVLKIDAENLTAVTVGDSGTLRIGDWVVAIGNALGEGIRATQGIVSRQDVSIQVDQNQRLYGLIETDAAINPGNSGGPLVNMAGEVIGITSAKLTAVEVEGTGYAISTEVAIPIIRQLINTGHAVHPWLGVSLYPVNQIVMERFDLKIDKGSFIMEVVPGSPADEAGLQMEDVIIGFAGKEVNTVDDLIEAIRAAQVGQEVAIVYWRGDTEATTSATLIERPSP